MSLFAGWSAEAARLPDRLDDLHGPWQGVVVLPVHLTWHGLREFDVAAERPRLLLYSIVLSQGRRNDLARFVNPGRLRDDWPQLRPLLSGPMRRACERKLGLQGAHHRAHHRVRHRADHRSAHHRALPGHRADPYARLLTCANT